MMTRLRTIDAHAGGGPLRLVVDGFPRPRGRTMADKAAWTARQAARLWRPLVLEPRGHADMLAAVLTEPVSAGSHAGVVFLDAAGPLPMSGHGIMAVTAIALERGLIVPGGDGATVVYDTAAGPVRARIGPGTTSFVSVPSFVVEGGVAVAVGARQLRADLAFGGAFYAIVDGEAAGVGVDLRHGPELRRAGLAIHGALARVGEPVHPVDPRLAGLHGTIFTGPAGDAGAALRSAVVWRGGRLGRSPGGTGTAAVMAVLHDMGLLGQDAAFVHEGLAGTTFRGRVAGRTPVGDREAIVTEIEGSAWVTGEHAFVLQDEDPLGEGLAM